MKQALLILINLQNQIKIDWDRFLSKKMTGKRFHRYTRARLWWTLDDLLTLAAREALTRGEKIYEKANQK